MVQYVFRNNEKKRRYELDLGDGYMALIDYSDAGDDCMAFTHTEVPPEFEGKGIGAELVKRSLCDLRDRGLKVIPACSFVSAYIRRHPDYSDMVGGDY